MPRPQQLAPVCFVDTETTALDRDVRQVWEVALIEQDGTEHVWQLPVDLSKADPISLAMNGFHKRRLLPPERSFMQWDGKRRKYYDKGEEGGQHQHHPATFAGEFADLTRGMVLAGANTAFDEHGLWKLLRAHGQCPMWHYRTLCVETLAAGFIMGDTGMMEKVVASPPYRHTDLVRALGVDPDSFDRHTALGDARMCKAVYEAVMG